MHDTTCIELLRGVPVFSDLSDKALDRLGRQMTERSFKEGETVTAEGERGTRFFFVIAEGNASVSIEGEMRTTLSRGDFFGEIALIDEGVRTATVTAATDLRCYTLSSWEFKPIVLEHPEVAWTLLETLAERLRQAEERAAD